ncbi:MAG: YqaJ viral recombinase family protein [Phycisphaerales bacterium]|nr:YqaJ viral recombinase family protein [Chloroflexota bacterium]
MSLSPKQLEMRRTGVGASEIAALAGLSKWSSPIALYEAKVLGSQIEATYAMDLGTEIEAPIARVWAKQHQRFIARVATLRHPNKPFAIATPDRAVYLTAEARGDGRRLKEQVQDAEKLLQVKSTNWRLRHLWGEEGSDAIPDEYLCQAHWEGSVAGLSVVDFAVDFDKTRLAHYRVVVDPGIFDALYEIAERFMREHVERRVPPPPDATDRYGEYLARAFPRDETTALEEVQASAEEQLVRTVELFAKLKAGEKRLKSLKTLCYNTIAARIGAGAGLIGEFGKITFKRTKDGHRTDWSKVAEEAQRLAALVIQTMPGGEQRAALEQQLAALVTTHTVITPGHRTMRTTWAGPLKYEVGAIELRLEQMQRGLASEGEDEVSSEAQS